MNTVGFPERMSLGTVKSLSVIFINIRTRPFDDAMYFRLGIQQLTDKQNREIMMR